MAGDDLDDELEYELDFSQDEGVALNEEVAQGPSSAKREPNDQLDGVQPEEKSGSNKKRKKNPQLEEKKKIRMDQDMLKKRNLSLETPELICDYANNMIRKKNNDLSALELAELYLNKNDFRSTADFTESRILDNLAKFLKSRFDNMILSKDKSKNKKKSKKDNKKSAPTTQNTDDEQRKYIAIMSMSAIRACDVHRAVRSGFPGASLKLLPKNKLEDDLEFIRKSPARVICCTPGRVLKAVNVEDSPLKKEDIKIVILDNSYLDKKQQNIWDIEQTSETIKELTNAGAKVYLY